jgi:hypothetical protein
LAGLAAVLVAGLACWAPPTPRPAGVAAPPTEGTDADGVAFRLSDYRGKVVLLDFWGDW